MRHVYQDQTIGGADILNSLADVNINNPEDGQMLVYDASTQRWRNVTQKSLNDLAEVTDLTNVIATGSTNATGAAIPKGLYFYLNDELCRAKVDIADGATFTLNTNYEEVTAGGLNSLYSKITDIEDISSQVSYDHTRIPTLWGLSVKKKNGICYIYMNYAVFNAAANNVTIVTGLPKCAQQTNGVMTGADAGQTAAISAGGSVSWIVTGGTALMAHIGTDYGRAHWISMAYPIDES